MIRNIAVAAASSYEFLRQNEKYRESLIVPVVSYIGYDAPITVSQFMPFGYWQFEIMQINPHMASLAFAAVAAKPVRMVVCDLAADVAKAYAAVTRSTRNFYEHIRNP